MFSTIGSNTDLLTLEKSLNGILSNVDGYGQFSSFTNSIFSLGGDIEAMFSGDEAQKANAIQGLVNKALKMVEKIVTQEVNRARQEVKTQTDKADELLARSRREGVQLEGEFTEIASSIDNQGEIVTEATRQIEEVKKAIDEKQEEAEAFIQKIEELQAELKTTDNTKDQAKILSQMHGFASALKGIGEVIAEHNKTLEALIQTVETTAQNIETATNNMAVVVENGQASIEQLTQNAGTISTEVVQTGAEGQGNNAAAQQLGAMADASASNAVTGATIAPKLMAAKVDQEAAGTVRLGSLKTNIGKIATGISAIENNSRVVTSFKNSIGASLGSYAELIGGWNEVITPIMTSVGSLSEMSTGADELITAIGSDLQTIGFQLNNRGKAREIENQPVAESEDVTVDVEETQSAAVNGADLASANFEIAKLRTFGV